MDLLRALAQAVDLRGKINAMFEGKHINVTEGRAVLHVALRMPKGMKLVVDGVDVVGQVHAELEKIRTFSDHVRSGDWRGATGTAHGRRIDRDRRQLSGS